MAPASRPVPEREVKALANGLISLARRRGFDVVALHRAVNEGNAADVCQALALAPAPCEELAPGCTPWAGASMLVG